MRPRNLTVVALMVLSSGVAAQQSVTLEVNEEMVAAASALLATVASGPGGAERLLGFDRSCKLLTGSH